MGVSVTHVGASEFEMDVSCEVMELWRYPVKSMRGERCQNIDLESRGVVGDRLFAVQDANGYFGSGKDTRRFRKIDGLLSFQAHLQDGMPQITFPSGETLAGDDPAIADAISAVLGQPIRLVREAEVSHLDAGPIHIVTRGALANLIGVAPEGSADAQRFRPNIVLSMKDSVMDEAWLGKHVRIGQAVLKFSRLTERCGMVTFAQTNLLEAPQILRHIAQKFGRHFGLYAEVIMSGTVRIGDAMSVVENER